MLLVLITIIILLITLILYQYKKKRARMEALTANIPEFKGHPVIGVSYKMPKGNGILENMLRIIRSYGKEKKMYKVWVGPKLFIAVSSPNDIEEILLSPVFVNKSFTYSFFIPFVGSNSVFTSNGETWKKRRKMIMPTFRVQMFEQFTQIFQKNSKILVECLECELSKPGFNVLPYIDLFKTDTIAETALGVDVNYQRTKNFELCNDIIHKLEYLFVHRVSRPWIYPDIIFNMTKAGREQKKLIQKKTALIQAIIDCKKQKRSEERDLLDNEKTEDVTEEKKRKLFIDYLLDIHEKGDNQMTNEDILGEVTTMIIAGQSSAAVAMSYAMYALSKHQDVQDKIIAEMNEIFDGSDRDPTFDDTNNMKYMEMVLKETMRMWPPAPYIARYVETDFTLKSGHTLPAGSDVIIFFYAMHQDADIYPNPRVFDPERFNYENSLGRSAYSFCPFSAGPRVCMGQKYAMTEMKIMLSYILRNYRILPASKDFPEMKFKSEMVLRSKTGVHIKIERRQYQ